MKKVILITLVIASLIGCTTTLGTVRNQAVKRSFEADYNYIALCRNIFKSLIECHPNRVDLSSVKDICYPGVQPASVAIHAQREGVYYSGVIALWDIYPLGENKSIIKYYDRMWVDVFANSTERWIKNGFTKCE